MDEDKFRREVLAALGRSAAWQEAATGQLAAIVKRLDDQEDALDRLTGKVDWLSVQVSLAAQASDRAWTEITALSRRSSASNH